MRRLALPILALFLFFLSSCRKGSESKAPSEPAKTPAPAISSPPTAPAQPKPSAPDLNAIGNKAKTASEEALGKAEKATAKMEKSAAEEVNALAKGVSGALPDVTPALGSSVSVDDLKKMVASLSPDKLRELADKLVVALQNKEAAADLVQQLKQKLGVVTDKLKEHGVDISKYTGFLK